MATGTTRTRRRTERDERMRHGSMQQGRIKKNGGMTGIATLAFISLALAVVVIASGIVLSIVNAYRCNANLEYAVIEVTVMPGDTLWGIARHYSGSEVDLRLVIDDIMRDNNLSSSVVCPGQVLRVSMPIDASTESRTHRDFHGHELANAGLCKNILND